MYDIRKQLQRQTKPSQETAQVLDAEALGDRLVEQSRELQGEQASLVHVEPLGMRYEVTLAALVEAKHDQAAQLEERLEQLIERQATRLQQYQTEQPSFLALPGSRNKWQQQFQAQQNALQRLRGRLEIVREIKDGMGLRAPRIEELAERKLRSQDSSLAHAWDELQEAERLSQAHRRKVEAARERQARRAHGLTLGLGIDRDWPR